MVEGKCIIFSAPSGAGKTTIVHSLLDLRDDLAFSISACSRPPRSNEIDGKDYHFLGLKGFKQKIAEDAFIEWEEVYTDHFYGTLKAEIERIWAAGKVVVFDVDAYGGVSLKKYFKEAALSFFISPPSVEILEQRLRSRNTETEEKIKMRLSKVDQELQLAEHFDINVVNEKLAPTIAWINSKVEEFIEQ
jgi:guanylate kinase